MNDQPDIETSQYGSPRSAQDVLGASQEPEVPQDAPEAGSAQEAPPAAATTPPKAFDARYRDPLTGLIYLGRLEDTFEWGGHSFRIRTLTSGEIIRAGLLIKPALGTRAEMKAHQASWVAGGLISVDGQPLVMPLGTKEITQEEKYRYILENWHSITIDTVYTRIYELEAVARELGDALGEARSQGL